MHTILIMKKILFFVVLYLATSTIIAQNKQNKIISYIDTINVILEKIALAENPLAKLKYRFSYETNTELISIVETSIRKATREQQKVFQRILFSPAIVDNNYIYQQLAIKETDLCGISFFAINNYPKLNSQFIEGEQIINSTFQDRIYIGGWQKKHTTEIEIIVELLKKIVALYSNPTNLQVTTDKSLPLVIGYFDAQNKFISIAPPQSIKPSNNHLFDFTDELATFEGSNDRKEIDKKLKIFFENILVKLNKQEKGSIYVQFTVDNQGKVLEAKILHTNNTKLGQIILDYAKELPLWKPAKHQGQNVQIIYNAHIKI